MSLKSKVQRLKPVASYKLAIFNFQFSIFLFRNSRLSTFDFRLSTSRESGFTLIEIIIGFALLSTAMLSAVQSYAAIAQLQQKGITTRAVQQDGRYVLESIVRDIRNAAVVVIESPTEITLTSSLDVGAKVTYKHDVSTGRLNRNYCKVNVATGAEICDEPLAISSDAVRITAARFEQVVLAPAAKPFVRIDLTVKQKDATLDVTPTDISSHTYELTTVVSPRDRQ